MDRTALYRERFALIRKVIRLEPADRVPVIYMGHAFAARYRGISIAEYCRKPNTPLRVNLETMNQLGKFDGINMAAGGRITPIITSLWLSRVAVPGRDLPPDSLWQVQEAEVMKAEEYDIILKKGWSKYLQGYWKRVINPLEFIGSMMWTGFNWKRILAEYRKHNYVVITDMALQAGLPFEFLCGARSMQQFFVDLYRMPDKIRAVMDIMMEEFLAEIGRTDPPADGIGGCWLGGWRSASSLLSPRLWNRFVWPYIVKLVEAMVERGIIPVLHWDQDWSRDLERLQELPAGKCILNPDGMTDMIKFRQVAGSRMAMMGDIPSHLLAAGTPGDIDRYVRRLVDLFERTGLLLCPGCDAPINARPENMEAFAAAACRYGGYNNRKEFYGNNR